MRNDAALRRSAGYCLLLVCLGLSTAMLGPTLPALAAQTQSSLGQIGLLFLCGSAGFALGTLLGGQLIDRVPAHPMLVCAQIVSAAALVLVPQIPSLWLLLLVWAAKGVADGCVSAATNTLLMWTHGEKVGPYMNALHFAFGMGAFIGPLVLAQFVADPAGYRFAYWGLAGAVLFCGLILPLFGASPQAVYGQDDDGGVRIKNWGLVASAALFLFFYVAAEITYSGWIYTYALTLNLADSAGAAYLVSTFWLAFTIGRLLSIPAALRFTAPAVLAAALTGCCGSLALVVIVPDSAAVLHAATAALGFCMAPIWPSGFALAGRNLRLTGRVSSIILLGDSLGGVILPWLTGELLGAVGPRALVFVVLASVGANVAAMLAMLHYAARGRSGEAAAPILPAASPP